MRSRKALVHQDAQAVVLLSAARSSSRVKVKTIFEDSPLGLDKWMTALWMLANCKNGISSYELASTLGIHPEVRHGSCFSGFVKSWMAVSSARGKIGGGPGSEVEADETFVGGKTQEHAQDRVEFALTNLVSSSRARRLCRECLTVNFVRFALR